MLTSPKELTAINQNQIFKRKKRVKVGSLLGSLHPQDPELLRREDGPPLLLRLLNRARRCHGHGGSPAWMGESKDPK